MGIDEGVANSILIKVNQIGTLTEAFEAIELAKEAGANILVAGNYLITAENLKEAVQSLK